MGHGVFDDEEGHAWLDPEGAELLHAVHEGEVGARRALRVPVELVVQVWIGRQRLHLVQEGVEDDRVIGGQEIRLEGLHRPVVRVGEPSQEH